MELAIPILALGGLYVVSNQKSNNNKSSSKGDPTAEKEEFTNMGATRN